MEGLIYNEDQFGSAISSLVKVQQDFVDIVKSLGEDIVTLRTEAWDSEAGELFLNKFKDSWTPTVQKYIDMMQLMIDTLETGKTVYGEVREEILSLEYINSD